MESEPVCATCQAPIGDSLTICYLSDGTWLVIHADCAPHGSLAEAG